MWQMVQATGDSNSRNSSMTVICYIWTAYNLIMVPPRAKITTKHYNNNNNDRLTAFDPGQPG